MKTSVLPVALVLLCAAPALAEPPLGCYMRDYSADHLKKNPNQHVAALRLWFYDQPDSIYRLVAVIGRFSDQGRARLDKVSHDYFTQGAFCLEEGKTTRCQVECDGGSFTIRKQSGDSLEISTDYFALETEGGGCEALSSLAELGGGETTYRLTRAPAEACRGVD